MSILWPLNITMFTQSRNWPCQVSRVGNPEHVPRSSFRLNMEYEGLNPNFTLAMWHECDISAFQDRPSDLQKRTSTLPSAPMSFPKHPCAPKRRCEFACMCMGWVCACVSFCVLVSRSKKSDFATKHEGLLLRSQVANVSSPQLKQMLQQHRHHHLSPTCTYSQQQMPWIHCIPNGKQIMALHKSR